jgi:hypothetical protein
MALAQSKVSLQRMHWLTTCFSATKLASLSMAGCSKYDLVTTYSDANMWQTHFKCD